MSNIQEIINFAIKKEKEAYNLYSGFAKRTDNLTVKKLFEEIAQDELGHREALENLSKAEDILNYNMESIQDLKLSDHLVVQPIDENSGLQEVFIFAMNEEKAASTLYTKMASSAIDEEHISVYQKLAQMELKHKNKLESLYEEMFYAEF